MTEELSTEALESLETLEASGAPAAPPPPPAPKPAGTFTVKNYIDAKTLASDITFNLADLSAAMMNQASLAVHYGVLLARASRQVDEIKLLLEVAEAKRYRIERDVAEAAGKKPTEAQLANSIVLDPGITKIKRALNEARQVESVAKTAFEGFRQRRDMLVQQGAAERSELKGDLSMKFASPEAEGAAIDALKQRMLARAELARAGV